MALLNGRVSLYVTCRMEVCKLSLFMTVFHKLISTKTINGEHKTNGASDELKVFEHGLSGKVQRLEEVKQERKHDNVHRRVT